MVDPREPDLSRLFKQAGHVAPGTDLTSRIMARVAVTPMLRPAVVRPLIGRLGWAAIIVGAFITLLIVWNNSTQASVVPGTEVVEQLVPHVGMYVRTWALWLAAIAGCALLLALVDRAMARQRASNG